MRAGYQILALLLMSGLSSLAVAESGTLTGYVVDEDTQQPLPGANVIIDGTQLGAATNMEGFFEIRNVPIGSYTLRADMIGYKAMAKANVRSLGHRETSVHFNLEPTILSGRDIIITAGYFQHVKDAATSVRSVDFEEIRSDPVGAYDILSMMQSLPSVVSGADQTNEIIVRGGAPGENLFIMDHLDIPYPVHYPQQGAGGGPVTMVNTQFIERIDFFAGSFPARYGDKVSSVMDVTVREGNRIAHQAKLSMDMGGFGADLEGPIDKNSSYLFSVKRSFLDFIIQNTGLIAVPQYWTFQGKVSHHLSEKESLSLNYLGGIDAINIVGEESPQNRGAENVEYASQQFTLGLTYKNLYSQKGYLLTSLGYNDVSISVDAFRSTAENAHETQYKGSSFEKEVILKTDAVHKFTPSFELSAGLKAKISPNAWDFTSYNSYLIQYGYAPDSSTSPGIISASTFLRDYLGDTTAVIIPLDTLASIKRGDTTLTDTYKSIGLYGQVRMKPTARSEVTLGGRVEYNAHLNKGNFSPRINLSYQLLYNLKINLAGGRYFQAPFYALLISRGDAGRELDFYHADQVALGMEYLPFEDTRITLEVYKKTFADMPVPEILVDRNGADSLAGYRNLGAGRSSGFELFYQKKFSNQWYGTFSYSHSISEGIDPRKETTVYYPWDYDYRNVVSLIGGYKIRYMDYDWYQKYRTTGMASATSWLPFAPADEFEISFRLRYSGGKPYTPKTYNHNFREWYTLASADYNTKRMPEYVRLDVMLLQRFYMSKDGLVKNLVAFWDIMNVLNRDNPWEYVYKEDGTRDVALQFKTFPVGGITLEF